MGRPKSSHGAEIVTTATGRLATRKYADKRGGRPRGVWYPDLVGVVNAYPKTQESFDRRQANMRAMIVKMNAEGVTGRKGVPNGWGGKKKQLTACREAAVNLGIKIVAEMKKRGIVTPENADPRAETALEEMAAIVIAGEYSADGQKVYAYTAKERTAAATLVLKYGMCLPTTSQTVAVTKAEDFLMALAAETVAG